MSHKTKAKINDADFPRKWRKDFNKSLSFTGFT